MNLILEIAQNNGRNYITPEDVSEAIEKYPSINDIRLDVLECLGGVLCRAEDSSLCAWIAWNGRKGE